MTTHFHRRADRDRVRAGVRDAQNRQPTRRAIDPEDFQLRSFFPYLVRIFYRAVSGSVSEVYAPRYGLSANEWRTMAVIGVNRSLSASEVVEQSSMDKINVSRAVKRLHEAGLLKRNIDGDDRRRSALHLTEEGAALYRDLVPRVLEVEEKLLSGLSAGERQTLVKLMARVRGNAESLRREQAAPHDVPAPGA